MSSNTKVYEDKMKSSVEHLGRELGAVRAGRACSSGQTFRRNKDYGRLVRLCFPCPVGALSKQRGQNHS